MKAFIVAALLVASVASQNLDLLKLNKEKSMLKFNRPVYDEVMLKKLGYPVEKTFVYGDNVEVPTYLQDELVDKKVLLLDLEEIIMTPLFREYMTLPLFRQYWSYPMFQRYVASTYFQQFWQIPTFKQYFEEGVLFYKYIYPLVTLFKEDTTTTTTFGDDLVKREWIYRNKNVFPFVTGQRDLVDNKFFLPTIYKQDKLYDQVFYKNLLEKIYNHLYTINKPVDTIFNDYKVFPTVEKMVDPITGEIKYITINKDTKLIDETIKTPFETIYGDKLVKDALLKKMLYKKMMPEIYGEETFKTVLPEEMLFREKYNTMYKYNPLVARMMYGYNKKFPTMFNTYETEKMMLNKKELEQEMLPFLIKKELEKEMLPMFIKKDLEKEILPMYLEKETLPMYLKKDLYNKIQMNKMFDNEMTTFETPKTVDITKFEHIPLTMGKPTMGVRTFDKFEKVIPEIKV